MSTILGPRFICPVPWRDTKERWGKVRTIKEMAALFPDFHSIRFINHSLDRYEDLHKAFEEGDRMKLMQLVTLAYYEKLKAGVIAKKRELLTFPKAASGKVLQGCIITSPETGLKFAHVSLEMTLKSLTGEKHMQIAVMERRVDPDCPDFWKIGLIEDSSSK